MQKYVPPTSKNIDKIGIKIEINFFNNIEAPFFCLCIPYFILFNNKNQDRGFSFLKFKNNSIQNI